MQKDDDQQRTVGTLDTFSGNDIPDSNAGLFDFSTGEAPEAEAKNEPAAVTATVDDAGGQKPFPEEVDSQEELSLEDPPEEDFSAGNDAEDSAGVDAPETDLDGMPLEEAMVEPASVPEDSSAPETRQAGESLLEEVSAEGLAPSAAVPEEDSAPLFDALSLSAGGTAVSEPLPPVEKREPQIADALVVPVGALGESLRKYREAAGVSVEDFAIRNKVLPAMLEALEAGSYRDVNDIFFLRRQLQRMFRDLDLNEDIQEQLLLQMEKEYHHAKEGNAPRRSPRLERPAGDPYFSGSEPSGRRPLRDMFSRLPGIVLMLVILIVLLVGVMYFLHPLLERHRNRNQNDAPLDLAPLVMPPVPQKLYIPIPARSNGSANPGAARGTPRRP